MIAVEVKVPGEDDRIVIVENAEDEMHARLVAYYQSYDLSATTIKEPKAEELIKITHICNSSGPVNAKIYKNPYSKKEIACKNYLKAVKELESLKLDWSNPSSELKAALVKCDATWAEVKVLMPDACCR